MYSKLARTSKIDAYVKKTIYKNSHFQRHRNLFLELQLKKTLPVHIKRFSFFALLGKNLKFISKPHTLAKIYSNKIQYEW